MLKKYREIWSYLIFGGLTVLINLSMYTLLRIFNLGVSVSTLLAWVLAMLFAFYTNRKYVFISDKKQDSRLVKEFLRFLTSRMGTLVIEMILTVGMIEYLQLNEWMSKIFIQGVVIVTNYLLSKVYVFK